MNGNRILNPAARIDIKRPLNFHFDGVSFTGYAGDTLASALLANGHRMLARSFKYGRPRGIVGAGAEEPNALVQVEAGALTIPNLKATQVELYEGLTARRTTGWPSLEFDLKSVGGHFSRFMPAGFITKHSSGQQHSGRDLNTSSAMLPDTAVRPRNPIRRPTTTAITTLKFWSSAEALAVCWRLLRPAARV